MVARQQLKTTTTAMPQQSRVIEHQLRDNPIYARTTNTIPTLTNNTTTHNTTTPGSQQQQHSYEKLDHVIVSPASNPAPYNLLTTPPTAAVTSPDLVNTMGYLVAAGPPRDQQQTLTHHPIFILAPPNRSRENTAVAGAELNVVTDQHGRPPCCCTTSASGLPSTATSGGGGGGGYMECPDARNNLSCHVIGGEPESRDVRRHATAGLGAEPGRRHDTCCWLARDLNAATNQNRSTWNAGRNVAAGGAYTTMNRQLNDWNISAL